MSFCFLGLMDYHRLCQIEALELKLFSHSEPLRHDSHSKLHTIDFWCPWIYDVPTRHDAGPQKSFAKSFFCGMFHGKIFEHVEHVNVGVKIADTVEKDCFFKRNSSIKQVLNRIW